MNPKVFISHASEDKERFVISFAHKLRAHGVDAWLDRWEMLPGDSLVDKIFEEGIKNSQAFIIVLSKNSVAKKWVREELDAAMVKRINNGSLLIPLVIDDCEVPECLQSTIWQKISDPNNYEDSFNRILSAIFEHRDKPPLGQVPEFARAEINLIPGQTKTDSIILKIACEIGLEKDSMLIIETSRLIDEAESLGLSKEVSWESLEILDHDGMVVLRRVIGGFSPHLEVTTFGLEQYASAYVAGYEEKKMLVIASIVNDELRDAGIIARKLGIRTVLVEHIFSLLESHGYVQVRRLIGALNQVYNISPKLKRLLSTL